MVYNGPSTGCMNCRRRKVKCSQERPACQNCVKRKQECPGYSNIFDSRHRNQTQSVIKRAANNPPDNRQKAAPKDDISDSDTHPDSTGPPTDLSLALTGSPISSGFGSTEGSSPLSITIPLDLESSVISFFNTNYGTVTSDLDATHGFFQHLLPLCTNLSVKSPLQAATVSIATNLFMLFARQGSDTLQARKQYSKAVSRLKDVIVDPERNGYDESIMTVLALDFYDNLNGRFYPERYPGDAHKTGALALVMHRGKDNLTNEISRQTAVNVRTVINHWAVENDKDLPQEALDLLSHPSLNKSTADQLDVLTLQLIALKTRFKKLRAEIMHWNLVTEDNAWELLRDDTQRLADSLQNWKRNTPTSWRPVYIDQADLIQSIKDAGLYGSRCAVYKDLEICHIQNVWRLRMLILLQLLRYCLDQCTEKDFERIYTCDEQISSLVDEICETVPFQVGDAYLVQIPQMQTSICYPYVMTDQGPFPDPDSEHPRQALASGGWIIYGLLGKLLRMTDPAETSVVLHLTEKQRKWMREQVKRIGHVYTFVKPL